MALSLAVALAIAPPAVSFEPMTPRFSPAAQEYRQLWESEGLKIIAAIEAVTGHPFPEAPVEVLVREGPSMLAFDGSMMRLRASHDREQKRAVLIHELGHRLALSLQRPPGMDDHRLLYLFLYDVWCDLYASDFADRMVEIERRNRGYYDYAGAWSWALSMSRDERQALIRAATPVRRPL